MSDVTARYQPGTPCWVDLAAPDQQAAIDFYSSVFGWTGEVGPPETGGYAVCELDGKPVVSIMAAMAMGGQPRRRPCGRRIWRRRTRTPPPGP